MILILGIFCAQLSMLSNAKTTIKWNMPTPYGDGYFHTKNIREFTAEIKRRTRGEINIVVHSGASLYSSTEIFRAVRGGQAEIGELLMANMGNEDPLFNVDSVPFLAIGYAESEELWDASRYALSKSLDKMGTVLLYAVPWPPQNFYSKEKIKDASFFNGRRLRSYNAITAKMASLLGASPTTIQVPEIPQGFSTGIIDAMITSGASGSASKAWDFTQYYTEVNAWMPKNMVFINKRVWRKLTKGQQNIIKSAAQKAEKRGWKYSMQANERDRNTLQENGMKIIQPNSDLMMSMKEVGDIMLKDWLKKTGKAGKDIVTELYN